MKNQEVEGSFELKTVIRKIEDDKEGTWRRPCDSGKKRRRTTKKRRWRGNG